jgi:hypothetical protein
MGRLCCWRYGCRDGLQDRLISLHPEIDDFRTEQPAKDVVIRRSFLKPESEMLIAFIKKQVFPDER